MNYWELIYQVPAAVAVSVLFVNIMPFSLNKKLNPWLMFLSGLLVLILPQWIVVALAMTIPMGLIYGWTGIRLQGHEPVKIPVQKIKEVASHLKPPPKHEVKEFLVKEFPDPSGVDKYVPEL